MNKNPFKPGVILRDPKLFAGRETILRKAYADICNDRNVFIIGERGIGKTSFALQLISLLKGDVATFDRFGVNFRAGCSAYITINHRCNGNESLPDLADQLISGLFDVIKHFNEFPNKGKTSRTIKLDLKYISIESTKETDANPEPTQAVDRFVSSLRKILDQFPSLKDVGICFKIDELDLVIKKLELATFFKVLFDTLSEEHIDNTVFVLIGIADGVNQLRKQHPSITRYFSVHHLERMSKPECCDIITRALATTEVRFHDALQNGIVLLSAGFPDPVHQLGYRVFEWAREHDEDPDYAALENAVKGVTQDQRAEEFAGLLNSCPNTKAEHILASIALIPDEEIGLRKIQEKTGISLEKCRNICNQYLSPMILQQKRRGYYRFTDPLFKEYLKLENFQKEWRDKKTFVKEKFQELGENSHLGLTAKRDLSAKEREALQAAFWEALTKSYLETGKASW